MYSSTSSLPSSVDCTLSLGTPSTRLSDQDDHEKQRNRCISNFCWDIWQSKSSSTYPPTHKTNSCRRSNNGSSSNTSNSTNDPLLARRCTNCDTTSTPLWRNGPRGPKSLCNACGIRFKKEERRATAANGSGSGDASGVMEQQQQQSYNAWVPDQSQQSSQKMACYSQGNEFKFIEDSSHFDSADHHNNTGIPYLSWRLNVTDRPTSLVHDFTR
ncbi:GATA transcription factor 18-like [Tripterygium wilfordii]|uniref:GATA transcription factor 18-like n=2 Tax=Tripterygium wilfordii TaxID=458696 RepID=A0A7J7CVN4_TRIWF|nr:GATA transcription factor 18-like [Tripterygium wilfordii]